MAATSRSTVQRLFAEKAGGKLVDCMARHSVLLHLAVLVDPRFKTRFFDDNNIDYRPLVNVLYDLAKSDLYAAVHINSPIGSAVGAMAPPSPVSGSPPSSSSFMKGIFPVHSHRSTLEQQLQAFLSAPLSTSDTCPLAAWKTIATAYPSVAPLARDLLSVMATSVPSESAFSRAGHLISKQRNRLDKKHAGLMMILQSWLK
ncbi:hypothetical protein RI367_007647 [Sorochytrium milnesiophthora]